MIAHPANVIYGTFHHSRTEQRYAGEFLIGVAFHISLCKNIQAILVAEVIEQRVVRIVRRTHGIDIQPLHGLDILFYFLITDGTSVHWREIMTVHPMKHHTLAVDGQSSVLSYLHLAEAHLRASHIQHMAGIILQRYYQIVEIRGLCTPQPWGCHLHGEGRGLR